jgi:hypothetical protein
MVNKKKEKKPTRKSGIHVSRNRDNGKKKVDLFAHLRNEEHPLDIIPKSQPEADETTGRPDVQILDAQTSTLDAQTQKEVDVQSPIISDVQTSSEKSYPSRKHKKRKTIRLPFQKVEKYELWCFMNKLDFQDAVEKAMDYLTGRPDAHVLIDDIDEDKETDEIIIFYRKWTGNKIKPKDRNARDDVKRFSEDICKIGILTAILRAKTKINSFKYCVPVIEEIAASTDELPINDKDVYVKYLQQTVMNVKKDKSV